MKRRLLVTLALVLVLSATFSAAVFAKQSTEEPQGGLFDAAGNEVFGGGVYYNADGTPVFGPGCWHYDANGNRVNAYGVQAFLYDGDGNLIEAPYGAWCRNLGGGNWNDGKRGFMGGNWNGGKRGGGCCFR